MEKRLRITFACPTDNASGGMRVIAIYAERLSRRGHKVTVVIPRHPAPFRSWVRALLKEGVWYPTHKLSFFRNANFDVRYLTHPGPVTDEDLPDADLLIATWWETAKWVWAASNSKGAKLHFMQDYETWGSRDISRVDAAVALPIPKIVIAQWVTDLLAQRWGQTPIALVLNSVQTEIFFAPPRSKQAVPTVGFVYTTMRNKGCDVIVAAIEQAQKHLPELRIIAFGQSHQTAAIPLPTGTEYHFEAKDEELRHLYAACDAWLFGTRVEGFGLPILEAMACRTPVIATPAGAAPILIERGGGILVPMGDVTAMSEAIVRISSMADSEWKTMSDAAHMTATTYTWEEATDKFEKAIIRVAQGLEP